MRANLDGILSNVQTRGEIRDRLEVKDLALAVTRAKVFNTK